ncbi:MAG: glutathione S-transferase family protein [Anaeromyxobacteraceae bacterium]|nr:glutathione S-transferase family protein [Anaeromyxobacteraceae bacterium]
MAYLLSTGNKNYSSWSLRPWLVLTEARIPFTERLVSLAPDAGKAARLAALPAGRVPVLEHDGLAVWDSLAICEYLAERHPGLWPADAAARAVARAMCAEMHAGFGALRSEMSMDVRARRPWRRRGPALQADLARVERLWAEARARFGAGGSLLFGRFSIADAFYAPVAFRFRTYGVEPTGEAGRYLASLLALPGMRAWEAAAAVDERLADHDLDLLYPEDGPGPPRP